MPSEIIESIFQQLCPYQKGVVTAADDVPPRQRFFAISVGGTPRWLVPHDYKQGLPTLRQWRPYTPTSLAKWHTLLRLYRLGLLGYLPGVQSFGVSGIRSVDWNYLSWDFHVPPDITIYVGTPGPTRKAVVTFAQPETGRLVSIMKIPLGTRAVDSITQEANALRNLEKNRTKVAPKLQYHDPASGWSLQEAINGYPAGSRLTNDHYIFIQKLYNASSFTTLTILAASLLDRLVHLSSLSSEELFSINHILNQIHDDTFLATGWVHGDFAPWNLKWVSDNKLMAVDWEFAESNSPAGLDLIHYLCRVNKLAKSSNVSAESFESTIINAMKKFSMGLYPLRKEFLKKYFRYYLVWYQIVLEERGIVDSTRLNYYRITRELLNESL